jgi:hypothetical protein
MTVLAAAPSASLATTCAACLACRLRNAGNVRGLDVPNHCATCGHVLCPNATPNGRRP